MRAGSRAAESPGEPLVRRALAFRALQDRAEVESVGRCRGGAIVSPALSGRGIARLDWHRARVHCTGAALHRICTTEHPVHVLLILARRHPFQVVGAVVGLVSVAMVHLCRALRAIDPCRGDEPVNTERNGAVLAPETDHAIPVRPGRAAKNSASARSPRRQHPIHRANATRVAHFVVPLETFNRQPAFRHDHHLRHGLRSLG